MASRVKIQSLYQQARRTFSKKKGLRLENGFTEELDKLQRLVNNLSLSDFGITSDITQKQWDFKPHVTNSPAACMEIYECPDFSIGLFLIKPQMVIPLHDHPDMHGIMKVLFGSMTVTSYSRRAQNGLPVDKIFSARVSSQTTYTPQSQPCCLEPLAGNLHEIVASEKSVVFLDILGPPYNPRSGRDCTYYYREPGNVDDSSEDDSVLLKPGSNPPWFTCIPLPYFGPRVDSSLNS